MGNIGKQTLSRDTQPTFTCFLNKCFLSAILLYYGPEGVLYFDRKNNSHINLLLKDIESI